MGENALDRGTRAESDPVIYCVVPPRLARIQPRLCEHFAGNSGVEVVIDQRIAERRGSGASGEDELAGRLSPGLERRTSDGRRAAIPIDKRASLPPELRRYERDLTFLARPELGALAGGEEEDWQRRCIDAEQQALALARALIAATEALRSRGGFSPSRFRELTRAEVAIDRYYDWCTISGRTPI